jgi:S1-C subfamily serine protease
MSSPIVDLSAVIELVRPSVVHLSRLTTPGSGLVLGGSGFCVAPGQIITNHHVLRQIAGEVLATTVYDERRPATAVCSVPALDLVVLSVPDLGLAPLSLSLADAPRLGQPVAAIGSAFGIEAAVTTGIVSSIDASHRFHHLTHEVVLDNLVVTDALIGSGNSGGPLIDHQGTVLAVATGYKTDSANDPSGLGFGIPARTVRMLLADIDATTTGEEPTWRRGTLGLKTETRPLSPSEVHQTAGQRRGLAVLEVRDPDPTAGHVAVGDLLYEFDGVALDSPGALTEALVAERLNRSLLLRLLRQGASQSADVVPRAMVPPNGRG